MRKFNHLIIYSESKEMLHKITGRKETEVGFKPTSATWWI